MELLGDVGHVKSRFGLFGDYYCQCNISAWLVAQKSFWTHLMELLGYKAQVVARFGPFGNSVTLMQDSCTVCTEHTIGSEMILDALNGTSR